MKTETRASRFGVTSAIFDVLDPIPFGFFVAALIFDILYANTFTMPWVKAAAWLISIGLVFAIVPQLINLGRTWFGRSRVRTIVTGFHSADEKQLYGAAVGMAQDAVGSC